MAALVKLLARTRVALPAALAGLVALVVGCGSPEPPPAPNLVIVLADDLGWGDLGVYGATLFETPNIDRLAAQGMRFTDAHAASAACSPSRYGLLTGRYPWRANLLGPLLDADPLAIDPERLTLADLAHSAGYATAAIGKWHLGFGVDRPDWNGRLAPGPLELGFDHYFGIPVLNSHPPLVYVEDHAVLGLDPADPLRIHPGRMSKRGQMEDWADGGQAARALYRDEEIGSTLVERAVAFIESNRDRRFLLYLAPTHIHHPFTPAPAFRGRSEAGLYGDFVEELDWMVGRVLETLARLGLDEQTLVVFTSDNGAYYMWDTRSAWRRGHRPNGPLLGQKFDVWEGGQRVPFIARWPGRVPAGAVSDALVSLVDLAATFAAITGQALPDDAAEDSFDLLPTLLDPAAPPPRDHVVLASAAGLLGLRQDDHVYIDGPGAGGFGWSRHRRTDAPLARWQRAFAFAGRPNSDLEPDGHYRADAPPVQLYDLRDDLAQSTNRIASDPARAGRMAETLRRVVTTGRTRPIPD